MEFLQGAHIVRIDSTFLMPLVDPTTILQRPVETMINALESLWHMPQTVFCIMTPGLRSKDEAVKAGCPEDPGILG